MLVRMNHREFTTESKRSKLSIIRFCSFRVSTEIKTNVENVHPYLTTLLKEHLVVFTESDAEYDRRDVLETVNPLLPFASLAANIEHATK